MEATLGAPAPEESGPAADDHVGDVALGSFRAAKERATGHWERGYLEALLRHCNGNVSLAARTAHMDRNHLRDLIRRHQVSAKDE